MEHSVLESCHEVVARASHVQIDDERIGEVASWMAGEELPWPDFFSALNPETDQDCLDFIFLYNTINFAFTDFKSRKMFRVQYAGGDWSDTEAMVACLKRALDRDIPLLEGDYLERISRADLESVFDGNIVMPMLDERLEIFREVGQVLSDRYQGRFHRFVQSAPPRLYANGNGLLERLVVEFPSFRDVSVYRGQAVHFYKRAQLLWWILFARFRGGDFFALEDAERLTAFADYIVPLSLRLLGILQYQPELDSAIAAGRLISRDGEEEVEIRASSIWAVHRLTHEINRLRPPELAIIEPVVDARLWLQFHRTHMPHHLTITTAY